MMAVVGSMPKVSGRRMATPFGPPSPGSTPTTMPSSTPIIMNMLFCQESATWNPFSRSVRFSIP